MSAKKNHDFYVTDTGVFTSEAPRVSSDRRLKNTISYEMERYEKFYRNLRPSFYKMNQGVSGRYHTGFIAQDVEDALIKSGLTTMDFSALSITPVEEINETDGIDDFRYRLAYEEFISLNTYMIQKLYHRVEELEQKLNTYESKEDVK